MKLNVHPHHHDLGDSELLNLTKLAAKREKEATLMLLDYLAEVDSRRLYATVNGCSSLFEYLVKELGFSEPSAADRVNTVRLMRAVPIVKEHLETGKLTLTSAAQIERSLKAEQKVHPQGMAQSTEAKTKLVNACLGKSKREVEKTLLENQSELARVVMQEKIRVVTPTRSEIKFSVDEATLFKLNELKNLIGNESLEKIFDQGLDALLLLQKKKRGVSVKTNSGPGPGVTSASDLTTDFTTNLTTSLTTSLTADLTTKAKQQAPDQTSNDANFNRPPQSEVVNCRNQNSKTNPNQSQLNSRFIPIHLKRMIFERSKGQCEYRDPRTHTRCASRFRLQMDHIVPMALNGKTEASNLRHLCFAHNSRMAVQAGLRNPRASAIYH